MVFGGIAAAAVIGMILYLLLGRGHDQELANQDRALGVVQTESAAPNTLPEETPSDVTTESTSDVPTESPTTDTASPTSTTKSPAQLRRSAIAAMEAMVEEDRNQDPIRDQWVAQLSSKYEGVVDKTQQSRPFTTPQILAEVKAARDNPEFGSLVRVVHQGDWGGSTPGPKTMWVTFVDIDASDRDQVVSWCEDQFSQRGKALLNVCYPRQMFRK